MTRPSSASLWRSGSLRLLVWYTVWGFTGFFITSASLPAWLVRGGTSDELAGLATTVLLIATVGVQLLVPRLVRRFGLGAVLAAGLVFLGAPSPLLLVPGGFGWVLLICLLRGIGFGCLTVLGSTLAAAVAPPAQRGEAVGIYGLAIAGPGLVAVPGGVALVAAGAFSWVAVIGAAPLLGLLAVPRLARTASARGLAGTAGSVSPSRAPDSSGPTRASAAGAGRSTAETRRMAARRSVAPATVLMCVTLVGGGYSTYLPIVRPDGALAAVALLVYGVAAAVSRWRMGLWADRRGLRLLLPSCTALAAVGIGIVVLGLLGTTPGGLGVSLVLAGSAVLGIGYGASQNLTLLAALARSSDREAATVSSVWNVGFDAGTAIGAGIVGAVSGALGVPGAMAATGLLVVATLPLAVSSARR